MLLVRRANEALLPTGVLIANAAWTVLLLVLLDRARGAIEQVQCRFQAFRAAQPKPMDSQGGMFL
jgi:hypothetical protein